MFTAKKRLAQKLDQGGQRASASVLEVEKSWTSSTGSGQQWEISNTKMHMELRLRVEPEGQPAFETSAKATFPDHFPRQGEQVQVIFDPDDHSKLIVDAAHFTHQYSAGASGETADVSVNLGTGGSSVLVPSPASSVDPADELSKLADLHDRGVLTDAEFEAQKKILGG